MPRWSGTDFVEAAIMGSRLGTAFVRVGNALAWRLHRLLGDRVVYGSLLAAARCWRRIRSDVVYVGVTGSAGKTTTKELMLGMLARGGGGVGNYSSFSNTEEIAKAMLRLRPSHRFFVSEVSGHRPNEMDRPLELLRPGIGIVTVVSDDHSSAEYSREAIAREKCKLVASLPPAGTAVLNADDDLVLAMASRCAGTVITYGVGPRAELRAEEISATWPDRLAMTLVRGEERVHLRTELCGSHWIPSVLGAVGGGLAAGMSLASCAEGLARVAPFDGRMQPVSTPDGVTFIRDDWKAPLWTVEASFEFMRTARAKRKIIVVGEISDVGPEKGGKLAKTAMLAQEIAEISVFIGPWASSVLKSRLPGREDALRVFGNVRAAAQFVNSITRAGDLVLLKGTNRQDHLVRIIMARTNAIACWRDDCKRYQFCNECDERDKPSGPPAAPPADAVAEALSATPPSDELTLEPDEQVIVGLGNPEPAYVGTPHNLGYEVVDQLALSLGLRWSATADALIARGSAHGRRVCLIKARAPMNGTGETLKRLADSLSFGPEQCVLVHDDLDTPLRSVRTRMCGGAGGHRGVASVLVAFQSDQFRRIKVGVAPAEPIGDRLGYVLMAFDAAGRAAIEPAIQAAAMRAVELVTRHPGVQGRKSERISDSQTRAP